MREKKRRKRRKGEEERKETRTTRESGVWNVEGDGKWGEGKDSSLGPQLVCSGWAVIVFTSPWAAPPGIHSYRSESLRFLKSMSCSKEKGHDDFSWQAERAPLHPAKVVLCAGQQVEWSQAGAGPVHPACGEQAPQRGLALAKVITASHSPAFTRLHPVCAQCSLNSHHVFKSHEMMPFWRMCSCGTRFPPVTVF